MPLKTYCPTCSEPNEYTLKKPLLCGFCGANLSSIGIANKNASKAKQTPKKPIVKNTQAEIIEDNENDIDNYINEIDESALEAEIEEFGESKGVKLGELAKEKKTGFVRPKGPKISKKKAIANFQQEARPKTREERELETIQDSEKE